MIKTSRMILQTFWGLANTFYIGNKNPLLANVASKVKF